jgi:hypothetical protein
MRGEVVVQPMITTRAVGEDMVSLPLGVEESPTDVAPLRGLGGDCCSAGFGERRTMRREPFVAASVRAVIAKLAKMSSERLGVDCSAPTRRFLPLTSESISHRGPA